MLSLKKLRILITLNIILFIVDTILAAYYDPTVSPLIQEAAKIQAASMLSSGLGGLFFFSYELVEILALIYSSIALWFGHRSGKWVFLLYLFLGCTDYYFAKVVALSWITMCVTNLIILLSGMILVIAFSHVTDKNS